MEFETIEVDGRELVLLVTCRDNVELMGVRSVLQAEGIDVFVQGEHHQAIAGSLLGAIVQPRVFVARDDLDDARLLLEEVDYAEHLPAEDEEVPEQDASLRRFVEEHPDTGEAVELEQRSQRLSPRRPLVAVACAVLVPLGGGHIYARRTATGVALGVLMVLTLLLWTRGWSVIQGVIAIIGFDAIGSVLAIRRDATQTGGPAAGVEQAVGTPKQ